MSNDPMSDRDFLNYCATHSDTPSALFSSEQVARCLRLAGKPDAAATWEANPGVWRSCDLSDLVAVAWDQMRQNQEGIRDNAC